MRSPPEKRRAAPARTAPEISQALSRPCKPTDSLDLLGLQAAKIAARFGLPIEHAALIASIAFATVSA